jgi:hypothetical protein
MNLFTTHILASGLLLALPLSAQVTLTDLGATGPSSYDTGHLGPLDNRYSFDAGDSHGQSFTPVNSGKLTHLDIAYNAGGKGSFKVLVDTQYSGGGATEILADATAFTINIADFITDPNGLSGSSADGTTSPTYWLRLDFSNENLQLVAGQQAAFLFEGVSETAGDSSFIFAPRYHLKDGAETDQYVGGATINGTNFTLTASGHDFGFAISLATPPPTAVIFDNFDSGNLTGGSGWLGPWTTGTVTASSPVASSGNYLSRTGLTGSAGTVRQWNSALVSSGGPIYTTRFDLRIDTLPDFGTVNGRFGITESSSAETNTSANMSWMIFGSSNFGLGNGTQPTWGFHNGTASGSFVVALVDSELPLIAGHTYRFEVVSSTADLAYAVSIDDLDDANPAYQSPRLGFRRGTPITNPHLAFSTQDVTGSGVISVDTVSVEAGGTLPPPSIVPATVADRVDGNMILLNDNGGWSWYQDERALTDPANGKILFTSAANHLGYGGEPRDGDIDAVSFDPATGERQRFILGRVPFYDGLGDDHNIGALWRRADGRYLATYCNHNDTSRNTRIRISTNPGDNSAWNPEFNFNWSAAPGTTARSVTYSNLLFLANEGTGQGRLYNIAREQNRDPHLSYSDDQGNTWSYGGRLSTQLSSLGYSNGYFKYKSNGTNRIDFICTEAHPRDFDNSIYHGYIQGGKSYNSLGVEIDANIFDDTAPRPQDFTRVWATQGVSATTYHHAWTSEIELDAAGRPVILFTTRYGNTVTNGHAGANDHRIFYGRFNGSTWSTTELGRNGELFHAGEQDYTGIGCIHPDHVDTLYISTYIHPATDLVFASKKREIFQGRTNDSGATWTWTQLTFDSTVDNARPIIPDGDANQTALLWWRGDYPWQRDYDLSVVGMILDPDIKSAAITYHDASPANTTLANGSALVPAATSDTQGNSTDHLWHESTGIGGNGGSVYCANFASSELAPAENAPALKTTITGLVDGTYDVFAYFLSPPATADWRVAAGFSESKTLNFRRASSQQAEATQFAGTVETLWSADGTALYRAYIGRKATTAGAIDVFIDDAPTSVAYDGIGIARVLPNLRVEAGESTTLNGDPTLYADIVNDGTLILKGSTAPLFEGIFTNNGFLDLLTYTGTIPVFSNNGTILQPGEGLRVNSITVGETNVTLGLGAHHGHFYQLQSSPDLAPGNWTNVGTPVEGQGNTGTAVPLFLNSPKTTAPRWFYRVMVD